MNAWFPDTPNLTQGDIPSPAPSSYYVQPTENTRECPPVTNEEVEFTFKHVSNTSAPGPSGLRYRPLKWAYDSRPDEFTAIVRASVKFGYHHPRWKRSHIVSVPKPGRDPSTTRAHRPIQLIECFRKLIEKVVTRRLLYECSKLDLIPTTQFGGKTHSSCIDAGTSLIHNIHEARKAKLVSSFLAIDIKGFFDHVQHHRLVEFMASQGLPSELCRWTQSFLSDRLMQLGLDGLMGDLYLLTLSILQGSPISPVLACLYAAPVLRSFMDNPDTTSILPVGPRSYVDDMGFLAISDSLHENTLVLERTLHRATKELESLGMSIDPTKCDLMHFSWRPRDDSSPSMTTTLYGKPLRITPPKYIRWLGFFLDRKLSFKHHVDILSARGRHVITGITGDKPQFSWPGHQGNIARKCTIY